MKKIALLSLLSVVFFAGCAQQNAAVNTDDLAKCLTANGVTMYGSVTCPHCQAQKAAFGTSFQYVTYVECTKDFERCSKLKGVPVWEFKDGTQLMGQQDFTTLATKANCVSK